MTPQVYLYTGPEFGERNDAADAVKKSLEKKYGTIDSHLFYMNETPFSQVMTILQSGTLFSAGVFAVCRNAELIKKKDDIEILSEWIKSVQDDSAVLVLVSDEISVDAKLDRLIPAQNKKKFWEMYEDRKLPWLQNFFSRNGYSVDKEAAELVLEMVDNNTDALRRECSRFFLCFPKGHAVTAEDVESILAHNREESAFTLFNRMSENSETPQKRLEASLLILQKIRLSKDSSSVMILAGLASCFRKLSAWHRMLSENPYPDDFYLKTHGFAGKTIQKQYRNAAKIWTPGQTAAILALTADTDIQIRSGGAIMEDTLLQMLLYEIIMKKGAGISTL